MQLAPNVGILSANHDLYDQRKYNAAPIVIGDYSWIGMNSIVTAGVVLGPRTIVAAGAVVTKSFPDGFAYWQECLPKSSSISTRSVFNLGI